MTYAVRKITQWDDTYWRYSNEADAIEAFIKAVQNASRIFCDYIALHTPDSTEPVAFWCAKTNTIESNEDYTELETNGKIKSF